MRTLCVVPVLLPAILLSQPNPFVIAPPDVADPKASVIVHRGDSGGWAEWYAALDRLVFEGEGQPAIVHIGGSHIQADIWSQRVRHRLQTMLPGLRAGRGMAFPYTLARTNNPWWYTASGTGTWTAVRSVTRADTSVIGLAGLSLTTRDTLSSINIAFRTDQYPGHGFDRARVLHRMDSSFTVGLAPPWDTLAARTVDHAGGYTLLSFPSTQDTLRLRITRTDMAQRGFTLYGIVLESDDPGIVYHSVGANGATTTSVLRCQRITEDLWQLHPHQVILSIGVNDTHDPEFSPARFKRDYAGIIARIRAAAPGAAILITTPSDNWIRRRVPNKRTIQACEAIKELGAEQGVAVWDLYGVMGGLGSMARWQKAQLAQKDRIHFNRAGYEALGDLMFTALMDDYARHLKRNGQP